MKTQKLLKTVSLVLIAVILLSSASALCASAANCAHSTERALLHNSGGFTIANLCKACGETVSVVGHVDSSKSINTYKASDYAEAYTDKQLSAGFSAAMGNALYVEDNVISKGGEPYWLIFDMTVGALPNLESGNASDASDRASKGWAVISMFVNGNFFCPLRLIADGWEEGNADGTSKGETDGVAQIKFFKPGNDFRNAATAVDVKAGGSYNVALRVDTSNGAYDVYVDNKYVGSETMGNSTAETESYVRFLEWDTYSKGANFSFKDIKLFAETYIDDTVSSNCYHLESASAPEDTQLNYTDSGIECVFVCASCGETVQSMLNKELMNPANDVAYRYKKDALMLSDLNSFSATAPKNLYLQNKVISKSASPYWLTFDVTPNSLPSNETGDLNDPNYRAYKGYALVSTEASYIPASELRVIPDGWETGNAEGTTKGVTDGKCEVKLIAPLSGFDATTIAKQDTTNYRKTDTVAYLEVGKTTSFALYIDPTTGEYDVYVDGEYKASSKKIVSDDKNPKIVFHDNGMGEFVYSDVKVCNMSQDYSDKVTSFAFTAQFAPVGASANSYTALARLERKTDSGSLSYNMFYVNNKTAELCFKDESGKIVRLCGADGVVYTLEEAKELAVVYDDINGDARYYVNGTLAKYQKGEELAFANEIKVYATDFLGAESKADSFKYNSDRVSNVKINGIGETDTAEIVGFQSHDVANAIRLLSGVDSLYYGSVGYEVMAYKPSQEAYNDTAVTKSAAVVYSSVVASGKNIYATEYGYRYFSALEIEGDFFGYKDIYIIVKPFTVIGDKTYYGESVRLNILDNGRYEFAEEN